MYARLGMIAAAALVAGGVTVLQAPPAGAVCGSIGGRHVDVSGCSDPLSELNEALAPPPPPPPSSDAPPPPPPPPVYVPPAPNVSVCANVGRRVSVSGCV
ncbi:RNA-binding protein [Mycolicibacterium grossiae]